MVSPGTVLNGRYRIDSRIASGGMGDVWKGTDDVLDRTVAIKIMLSALLEEPGFVKRFHAEAKTMAGVNHPGVVRIYDFGNDQHLAYLIMELIEGDPLSRTLNKVGRLTPARTMMLIAQAADALQAAHDKGIVHRDVKPGNLLVRPNGTLVLTDFGIARSAAASQLTATGAVMGTASYLAPEQASGVGASAISDVYSLGVVAYQCLTGHRPYDGDTPLEIAMKHVTGTPKAMPNDIPPVVRQIVERAMAKEPGNRWPTAAAFANAARQAAGALSHGTGPTLPVQPVSPSPVSATPVSPGPSRPLSPAPGRPNGGYQRGSAPVPAAPASLTPVHGVPYGPQAPAPAGGGGRTALTVVLVVIGMLAVLACAGYAGYLMRERDRTGSSPAHSELVTLSAAGWLNGTNHVSMDPMTEGRRTR
ncbi:putative serine/threonine-protein kinase PknA [Catellatospora methionotrophica]|uniref:non-specific serine/threonine protein kinase n=1 Tax=Catellatospora methionotrophica TaxID=121620 RepID=A0A8J3PFC1_9ACTN|nr:serine/threonine-protein kinase [Catellatospora methionotrophica]GIG14208.1 putative serine/threonine-protein kinase PknA [Catellatospora methionotrophica]